MGMSVSCWSALAYLAQNSHDTLGHKTQPIRLPRLRAYLGVVPLPETVELAVVAGAAVHALDARHAVALVASQVTAQNSVNLRRKLSTMHSEVSGGGLKVQQSGRSRLR